MPLAQKKTFSAMATKGKFITFEGGEGSGKSTQLIRLADGLKAQGISVVTTREPGGSPAAEVIRTLLVEGAVDRWQPVTEVLLHYAARAEHIASTVLPALQKGAWVLSDRFSDSTIAYQGYGHGLDRGMIDSIDKAATGGLAPDLTLVLDIPVSSGLERAHGRAHMEDRYERMGERFHERVRAGFLEIAAQHPNRCVVVDAAQEIDVVSTLIGEHVQELLGSAGQS